MFEIDADGSPKFWLLYRPEPEDMLPNQAPIHLWVRRAELFQSEYSAKYTLQKRIPYFITWTHHELFPELQIGIDTRGFRWLLEPVPLT